MGIYVRKKIPYTGGGSGEGTGSDDVNVRYNEESDFFEVKKNGEWESTQIRAGLNKLYLYDNGDHCTSIGGAWESVGSLWNNPGVNVTQMSVNFTETVIIIPETQSGYGGTIFKENPIDLTGYDKLYIDWAIDWNTSGSGGSQARVVISNTKDNGYTLSSYLLKQWSSTDINGRDYIDISALNGEFYIGIAKYDYVRVGIVTVRQVWCE